MKTVVNIIRLIFEPFLFFILYAIMCSLIYMSDSRLYVIVASLLMSAVMVGIYALVQHFADHRSWSDIFHFHRLPEIAKGFGIGAVFMSVVVAVIAILGCYHVIETDLNLSLISTLFLFLFVAVGEEVTFRGAVYKRVEALSNKYVAIVMSGLVFGFIHIMNDNATVWSSVAIAIEAGCMLAAAYIWKRTLLFPIGIHWAWNYFEGCIFGTAVSGSDTAKLFVSEISGNDLISGGQFGPEASVVAVVLGTALTVLFLYHARKMNVE